MLLIMGENTYYCDWDVVENIPPSNLKAVLNDWTLKDWHVFQIFHITNRNDYTVVIYKDIIKEPLITGPIEAPEETSEGFPTDG